MTDQIDYVASLVRESGGEVVGKTRLQKIAYLLEAMGLGFDLKFDYHNYGPFSAELAYATEDAESLSYIVTEERFGFHSVPYTVYRSTERAPIWGEQNSSRRRAALELMQSQSALVLELAATAAYLQRNGFAEDPWAEVRRRKSSKAKPPLVQKAKALLRDLKLQ